MTSHCDAFLAQRVVIAAASGIAVAVTKNRATYGEFDAFNQVAGIVTESVATG